MSLLSCVEVETHSNPVASVIWLHGLGADGHDFEPIVPVLNLPANLPVRFVFPHSPKIPVTINGGMVMPAWYDILDMSIERKVDATQLVANAKSIHQLIDREIERGVPADKIIIAGFSQGGAVALEAALSYPKALAGLMAMSTYFATKDSVEVSAANASLDTLVMHGSQDPVVPPSLGEQLVNALKQKGFTPAFKSYPMPHAVCQEQIADISAWLQQRLA
ncbi:alpha/beta hydrolase [Thalassotalea crassostreae]|uniref:alpha/beta hydrolase n=1 Tax=Thalassotalea crassostreae TaxID=1763536 RepID=UPI0008397CE1|nr:dienelactone hydrolase family protein [Thalassotalea crassostreae]